MTVISKNDFKDTPGVSKSYACNLSSSIFWFENNKNMRTIISFLNYWKIKNNLKANIEAITYCSNGNILERKNVTFDKGNVLNLCPLNGKTGKGSIEIKITSKANLKIPYAAIVGIYETKFGLTAVHSYTRLYYEKEEMKNKGNEGSWTIRDSEKISSFCVFHNGSEMQPAQKVKFTIQNEFQEILVSHIEIPSIPPYGVIKINLINSIKNLREFLKGGIGTVSVNYEVKNSFTRLLIGNESIKNGHDMQVTHSNFNYKTQGTDFLQNNSDVSLHLYPGQINKYSEFIVYPHLVPGNYEAKLGNKNYKINNNQDIVKIPISQKNKSREIKFYSKIDPMPSRFQIGLVSKKNKKRIPNEVAFSAITSIEPRKRFHWGVCGVGKNIDTKLVILDLGNLDSKKEESEDVIISFYSTETNDVMKSTIKAKNIKQFVDGKSIYKIFKEIKKPTKNMFGYFSVFSNYGRYLCYSETTNQHGSIFKEHSF